MLDMPKWFSDCQSVNSIVSINILLLGSKKTKNKTKLSNGLRKYINKIGDQQTLVMFILSDQIIILFPADTFSTKQLIFRPHYKCNKYKLLGKKDHAWPSFALTMPKVGFRYSKFGFEKKKKNPAE